MNDIQRQLIIRKFRKKDAKDVAEIFKLVDDDSRPPEAYERWASYPDFCLNLVAEMNGKVVGRLLVDQLYPTYQELVNFAIHPDYQGQGLGKTMVKEAIHRIEANPNAIPFLKVDDANHVARRLYERNKFLPAIQGNQDLNHWLLRYESASLTRWFIKGHPNSQFEVLHVPSSDQFCPRILKIPDKNADTLKDVVHSLRLEQQVAFIDADESHDALEFSITGHPDQIIGFIEEEYCVPGLPPCISGVSLIENDHSTFMAHLTVTSENGEARLHVENRTTRTLHLKMETIPFTGVHVEPQTFRVTLKASSSKSIPFKVLLKDTFMPQLFQFSSYEAVPLSITISDEHDKFPSFHVTRFFWYRTLSSK